jgi:PAS domain S-box-containing protein
VNAGATVLYVGSGDEVLDFVDALADPVTVLSVSDGQAVADLVDDDRVDCVVCADPALVDAIRDVRAARPALPILAVGVDVEGVTSLDPDADVATLAAAVSDALAVGEEPPPDRVLGSPTQLAQVLDRITDGFFAVDSDWRITYFNASDHWTDERDPDGLVGRELWTAFPGAVGTEFESRYREAMRSGDPVNFEAYYEPHDAWYAASAYPATDGLSVYFRDVTARKEREADRRLKTRALEAAPIGVTITDPSLDDNPLVFVNDAFTDLVGYDEDEVLGRNCRFLQGSDTDPETVARMREAIDAGEPVQVDVLNYRQDGTPFWNRVDIAPVRDADGEVTNFVGFQQDVTDRTERQRRLRSLTETTHAMMLAATGEEVANLAVAVATDVLGLPWVTVWRFNEAENAFTALASSAAAAGFADGALPVETDDDRLSARDTPIWPAFVDGEVRTVAEFDPATTAAFPVQSGVVAPLSDFGVLVAGDPDTDPDSRLVTDSELVRILATSTEAALLRAQRERELQRQVDRLDEFVGVVSHDLRNPLQVAQARLDAFHETGEAHHLDHVADSHDRMRRLIEDVLTLAREGRAVTDPEQVALATVAAQAWAAIDAPDATLESPTSATLVADADRLRRLFENLFRNAVEHAGDDVTVTVDTLQNGFYVADDGPGIPEDDREAIFEKGYTTSEDGTGFGLGIVKGIAQAHGWTVTATESSTGGARFEVTGIPTLSQ